MISLTGRTLGGSHRWNDRLARRLRRTAAAWLALAIVGTALAGAPVAQAAGALDPSDSKLTRQSYESAATSLAAKLPHVSVSDVLDDSNHAARVVPNGDIDADHVVQGFAWDTADAKDTRWYPQGITSSTDAFTAGQYENREVTLVSWHTNATTDQPDNGDKNVRISFVDRTDPAHPVYRQVLLAQPFVSNGVPNFRAVSGVHAGGIAWYGHYLYVASSRVADPQGGAGLRVFDLNRLLQVETGKNVMGRDADGKYYAHTYKYILPQVLNYKTTQTAATYPGFSYLAFDRTTTPDSLIAGQYETYDAGSPGQDRCTPRIARWSIDFNNRELVATNGVATATWARQMTICSVQGAVSISGKYFLNRNHSTATGDAGGSDLFSWFPDQKTTKYPYALNQASNDFTYDPRTDELWTLSEGVSTGRFMYSVASKAFP